jgi:adenylosuccinate synthase
LADLLDERVFTEKLAQVLDYHNFALTHYFQSEPVDLQQTLDENLGLVGRIRPMTANVSDLLHTYIDQNKSILFEGAQGTLLDIDHGTYPFVTSSNTCAAAAALGVGVAPSHLHYVLGITKAYTTRVGAGPFPTELHDNIGERLGERGNEFGATTGRPRRCGWFDAVGVSHACRINGVSGLCITKLDVLDGLESVRLCVAYEIDGERRKVTSYGADELAQATPVYEELPGWTQSTVGVRRLDGLPLNARYYLERVEETTGVSVHIISTGAERADTIIFRHPFDA